MIRPKRLLHGSRNHAEPVDPVHRAYFHTRNCLVWSGALCELFGWVEWVDGCTSALTAPVAKANPAAGARAPPGGAATLAAPANGPAACITAHILYHRDRPWRQRHGWQCAAMRARAHASLIARRAQDKVLCTSRPLKTRLLAYPGTPSALRVRCRVCVSDVHHTSAAWPVAAVHQAHQISMIVRPLA